MAKKKIKKESKKEKEARLFWERQLAKAEAENRHIKNNLDMFGVYKGAKFR